MSKCDPLATIGVLGGMGPQATVQFMQRLIDAVPARDDGDHVPLLVDQNTQVPSRIDALIGGDGDDPAPILAMMAQRLEQAGAKALAMPCNTAHAYTSAIRGAVSIPFISMVEETTKALAARHPGATVGMLASPAVMRTRVFEVAFADAGLTLLYAEDQDGLLTAIRRVKHVGPDQEAGAALAAIAAQLRACGADIALIACSEFSLLAGAIASDGATLDSLDILVEATIHFSQSGDTGRRLSPQAAHRPGAAFEQNQSGQTTREAAV